MRRAHWTILTLLVAALAFPAGAAAQGGGSGFDTPPIVSNPQLNPTSLPYQGGTVTISADAIDDFGITMFYADVQGSDGSRESVGLGYAGGDSFSGLFYAPPNYTDSPVSYYVTVEATDGNGGFDTEIAGEIQVDAQPQFDEAPIASDPLVSPRELPAAGGTVTISAAASDNRGISEVYATITLPGGGSTQVPLEPISSSRYEGVYVVPPNGTGAAHQYGVEIVALDDIGQPGTVDGGFVTVAGRAASPPHSSPCKGRHRGGHAHHKPKPHAAPPHRPGKCR